MKKFFIYVLFLSLGLTNILFSAKKNDEVDFKVNPFAWYASLQVMNFMPISYVEKQAGVILSDWYNVSSSEKFKIDVYVVEEHLSSRTIDVRVFRRIKDSRGNWINTKVSKLVKEQIELSMLNVARKIKIEYLASK